MIIEKVKVEPKRAVKLEKSVIISEKIDSKRKPVICMRPDCLKLVTPSQNDSTIFRHINRFHARLDAGTKLQIFNSLKASFPATTIEIDELPSK